MKSCSVKGCTRPAYARRLCEPCYAKARRAGLKCKPKQQEAKLAFLLANATHEGDECLIWPFPLGKKGRGSIRIDETQMLAARAMCIIAWGDPPFDGAEAAHSCGRGHFGCVHPGHVYWATRQQNSDDQLTQGARPRGERRWNAKITNEQALAIYADTRPINIVAEAHGVTVMTATNIRYGQGWAWLTGHTKAA